mgnify:CR=1 FL=1
MAESVDALVSNTSGATHPGSSPGLGTKKGREVRFSPFFVATTLVRCIYGSPKKFMGESFTYPSLTVR